ncbi:hypothetical protein [Variovorax paradoxus]|uniref:hypothetical protein n=1 Tax=Variovorax paradoxus TaxID=34073 RepID=UPI0029C80E9A|nr:hypothetical protein [Variovorax paradoxus]WPH18246.1 hypothetical protein RZE78_14510 [Variovorax paradoxus]
MNAARIDYARKQLTDWTIERAARMARDIGFSYEPATDAPNTFEEVCAEFGACTRERRGFRVWVGASDKTIYTTPEGNYAFRYMHDVMHAVFKHPFDLAGEIGLARRYLAMVRAKFGKDSLEARMVWIDTAGQSMHHDSHGEFPEDQMAFLLDCIDSYPLPN